MVWGAELIVRDERETLRNPETPSRVHLVSTAMCEVVDQSSRVTSSARGAMHAVVAILAPALSPETAISSDACRALYSSSFAMSREPVLLLALLPLVHSPHVSTI